MKKIFTLAAVAMFALAANADNFTWQIPEDWQRQENHKDKDPDTGKDVTIIDKHGTGFTAGQEVSTQPSILSIVPSIDVECKSDNATAVTLNEVNYDKEGILQGETNGMFFAFTPAYDGTLDVAIKMGSDKKTYVIELSKEIASELGVDKLTGAAVVENIGNTCSAVQALVGSGASNPALIGGVGAAVTVGSTWDGSAAINITGTNEYEVISLTATAGNVYIIGCDGSKLMFRGASLIGYTAGGADGIESVKTAAVKADAAAYNLAGQKVAADYKGLVIVDGKKMIRK